MSARIAQQHLISIRLAVAKVFPAAELVFLRPAWSCSNARCGAATYMYSCTLCKKSIFPTTSESNCF